MNRNELKKKIINEIINLRNNGLVEQDSILDVLDDILNPFIDKLEEDVKNKKLGIKNRNTEIKELKKDKEYLDDCLDKQIKATLDLQKENAELKEQCLTLADCNTCTSTCKSENIEMQIQLAQAKEIIKDLLSCCRNYPQENAEKIKQAEQFLNKGCPDVLCEDCKKDCPIEKIKE